MTTQSNDRTTSPVTALGYFIARSDRLADWKDFGRDIAGFQVAEQTAHSIAFRMDERRQRFLISDAVDGDLLGFEVPDADALAQVAGILDAAGVPHQELDAASCTQRGVTGAITCRDPEGNRLEFFHGAWQADEEFSPGRNLSGFQTGSLGLGHAVLLSAQPDRLVSFYQGVLGFRLSDFMLEPFEGYFFHVNPRHHSLAVVRAPRSGVHHVMVELDNLDDVGQGFDLAEATEHGIGVTLGRHSNDHVISFYARTPSAFMLEYGWGGRTIDPQTWQPYELTEGPSIWGHERSWLPDNIRAVARTMRVQAAADGYRYPVHVRTGNYELISDDALPTNLEPGENR